VFSLIQLDDAGSGSLIGGTCIGAIRVETNEYYYDFIPISYYCGDSFNNKLYLDYVIDITSRLFKKLNVNKNEQIKVCRGYMFDRLRKWLSAEDYYYENTKIVEPLQSKIEQTFEDYCVSLGLFEEFIKYNKYPFHFHRILKWVYADYDNRIKLCKTGWKSWQKYGNLNTEISLQKIHKSNYFCLKCGYPIDSDSVVKTISYFSNKPTVIYLHKDC
jgi:hypothetical protein